MAHDWILDVLTDLKTFARSNGLSELATQLDETRIVATAEIALFAKGTAGGLCGKDSTAGRHPGDAGTS